MKVSSRDDAAQGLRSDRCVHSPLALKKLPQSHSVVHTLLPRVELRLRVVEIGEAPVPRPYGRRKACRRIGEGTSNPQPQRASKLLRSRVCFAAGEPPRSAAAYPKAGADAAPPVCNLRVGRHPPRAPRAQGPAASAQKFRLELAQARHTICTKRNFNSASCVSGPSPEGREPLQGRGHRADPAQRVHLREQHAKLESRGRSSVK